MVEGCFVYPARQVPASLTHVGVIRLRHYSREYEGCVRIVKDSEDVQWIEGQKVRLRVQETAVADSTLAGFPRFPYRGLASLCKIDSDTCYRFSCPA